MPKMSPVHSSNEPDKPLEKRMYHDNSNCGAYKAIPLRDRVAGTGGYRLCRDCIEEAKLGH